MLKQYREMLGCEETEAATADLEAANGKFGQDDDVLTQDSVGEPPVNASAAIRRANKNTILGREQHLNVPVPNEADEEEKVIDHSRDSSRLAQEYDERQIAQYFGQVDGKNGGNADKSTSGVSSSQYDRSTKAGSYVLMSHNGGAPDGHAHQASSHESSKLGGSSQNPTKKTN